MTTTSAALVIRVGRALGSLHDGLTRFGFWAAMVAVAAMIVLTGAQVLMRYFLGASTQWIADSAIVALAASVFLATPELTRQHGHIAMTFVVGGIRASVRSMMVRAIYLLGASTCLFMGWVALVEALRLHEGNVSMITVTAWPKWWVVAMVSYGLISMGLYFLRYMFLPGSILAGHVQEGQGAP